MTAWKLNRAQLLFGPEDDEVSFEASTIGLTVGAAPPMRVEFEEQTYHLIKTEVQDGDVLGWEYETENKELLVILND